MLNSWTFGTEVEQTATESWRAGGGNKGKMGREQSFPLTSSAVELGFLLVGLF